MKNFVKNESLSDMHFAHIYSGIKKEDLDNKLVELFSIAGYRMIDGKAGNAIFEKGNRTTRILLGAFHKYFKFTYLSEETNDKMIRIEIRRATSGMSGGIFGMSQVKKELSDLALSLTSV